MLICCVCFGLTSILAKGCPTFVAKFVSITTSMDKKLHIRNPGKEIQFSICAFNTYNTVKEIYIYIYKDDLGLFWGLFFPFSWGKTLLHF